MKKERKKNERKKKKTISVYTRLNFPNLSKVSRTV